MRLTPTVLTQTVMYALAAILAAAGAMSFLGYQTPRLAPSSRTAQGLIILAIAVAPILFNWWHRKGRPSIDPPEAIIAIGLAVSAAGLIAGEPNKRTTLVVELGLALFVFGALAQVIARRRGPDVSGRGSSSPAR